MFPEISKSTLKSIQNKMKFQIGKQNINILKKLYVNIYSTYVQLNEMKKTQRKEFSERLTEIFQEDAEILLEKFVEGFGKKNFLKNKIKEMTKALSFCRMFKASNQQANTEIDEDRFENFWRRYTFYF